MPGVIQTLRTELDKRSIADAFREIASLGDALSAEVTSRLEQLKGNEVGTRVARETVAGLKRGFDADLDALRLQVERGIVKPEDFAAKATEVGQRFNAGLLTELNRLADDPTFTVNPFRDAKIATEAAASGRVVGTEFAGGVKAGVADLGGNLSTEVSAAIDAAAEKARGRFAERSGALAISIDKKKLGDEAQASATALVEQLKTELDRRLADLSALVAKGAISPEEFAKAADNAAEVATAGITNGILKLGDDPIQAKLDLDALIEASKADGQRAADELTAQFGEAVKESGAPEEAAKSAQETARAFVEGIEKETAARKDRIKLAQAEGLLTPAEATNAGHEVAQAHNQALLRGVRDFRSRGELTPEILGTFTKSFEDIGDKVPPLSFFEKVKNRVKTQAVTIAAGFAGLFAAREIFRFAEGAVSTFLEDDKALQRVRTQVAAAGQDYTKFAARIDAVSERLRRLGAASGGQVSAGIASLISVSGDVNKSLGNIGLAADFAAKHNLTFEQGVELVGRAMVGQVTGLKKYGIAVKDGDDAIVAMAKDSQGFLDKQAPNLAQAVNKLSFAWNDLKSAIGEAIVDAGGGTSAIDLLTTALRDGVTWVKAHREEVARWGTALVDVARFIAAWVVIPIVRGFTTIVESFEDVGLTIDGLWQRFKFIGGGFALIAANMSDAWNSFLKSIGLFTFDPVGNAAIERLRAWGNAMQAEAVKQKAEIDRKLGVLRGETPKTASGKATTEAPPTGDGKEPLGGAVKNVGADKAEKANDALDKRIALLTQALRIEAVHDQALAELNKIEEQVRKRLEDTSLSLGKRIDLEQKLAAIERGEASAIDDRIAKLTEQLNVESQRAAALKELIALEKELRKQAADESKTPEERAAAQRSADQAGEQVRKVFAPITLPPVDQGTLDQVPLAVPKRIDRPGDVTAPVTQAEIQPKLELTEEEKKIFLSETQRFLKEVGEEAPPVKVSFSDDLIKTFFDNLDIFAHNAAEGIGSIFEDTFSHMLGIFDEQTQAQIDTLDARRKVVANALLKDNLSDEQRKKLTDELDTIDGKLQMLKGDALNVGQALANLGKGMAKSILKEIAAMAKGKALENVATAIEETAKGFAALASFNPGAASLHFKAAGTAALAAVKWGLVAGGAGALASQAGGGGGGGAGSEGSNRSGEGGDTVKSRQTVTFFIKGGLLNTDDHRQMDELAKGIRAVTDRDVVIRRD
jgi:hypothetical protein